MISCKKKIVTVLEAFNIGHTLPTCHCVSYPMIPKIAYVVSTVYFWFYGSSIDARPFKARLSLFGGTLKHASNRTESYL